MAFDRKANRRAYYLAHREEEKAKALDRYYRNSDDCREKHRQWLSDHLEGRRRYALKKYNTDLDFKFKAILRNRFYKAVKRKNDSAIDLIGCTIEELKQYIAKQFTQGMDWSNWSYRGWHIDHIKPLSAFDLDDPKEIKKAFHYTNLQPLWREANMHKSFKHG